LEANVVLFAASAATIAAESTPLCFMRRTSSALSFCDVLVSAMCRLSLAVSAAAASAT
jgi:hypothetical protein